MVKKEQDRGRYAIGAAQKLASITGVAYLMKPITPFAVGRTGESLLVVANDRPGQVRRWALVRGRTPELLASGMGQDAALDAVGASTAQLEHAVLRIKRTRAVELLVTGCSYGEIARQVGFTNRGRPIVRSRSQCRSARPRTSTFSEPWRETDSIGSSRLCGRPCHDRGRARRPRGERHHQPEDPVVRPRSVRSRLRRCPPSGARGRPC